MLEKICEMLAEALNLPLEKVTADAKIVDDLGADSLDVVELLSRLLAPLFGFFGIPPETALLVLVRPLSGSAALAVGAELMAQYGPDSTIGRTVAVMLGSTETTFYTISVYFGAAGIRRTRYTVPAALFADFVGFFMASLTVRLLF